MKSPGAWRAVDMAAAPGDGILLRLCGKDLSLLAENFFVMRVAAQSAAK
jgi:hypothetical protein